MNVDEAREVYLSFAGAEESAHHGHPDFRVGNKIFASLQPEKGLGVLRLPMEMAEAVASESPDARRLVSRFGGCGWVAFTLSSTEVEEFRGLAEIAFQHRQAAKKG